VVQVSIESRDDPCNSGPFNRRRSRDRLFVSEKSEQMPQRGMSAGAWTLRKRTSTGKRPHRRFINLAKRLAASSEPAEKHLGNADIVLDRVAGVAASVQIDEKSRQHSGVGVGLKTADDSRAEVEFEH
jgi:hypothetical protein